jgi:uncharacterized protein with gpF-like domain
MMRAIERAYEPKIAAELARAYTVAVAQWERTGAVGDIEDHQNNMRRIASEMAAMAVRAFGAETDRLLKRVERRDFAATLAKLAGRYIALEAFRRRIVDIAETTRNQVIAAVARGFDEGLGQSGVARFVLDLVPQFSKARAGVIARTETHGAANYGALGAAKETGLDLRKIWIAAEDERTREDHAQANGQTVGIDDAFDVGGSSLMYPGDPAGPAGQVINCRCTHGYVPAD